MYEESNSLCRLCLSEETLDGNFRDENCYRWISDYLSIQINLNDQMSKVICAICHLKLSEFHEFRIRCLEVQEVLQTRAERPSNQSSTEEEVLLEVLQTASEKHTNDSTKESQPPATIQCSKCSKVCDTKKQLWNHMRCHKEEKFSADQLKCEVCHKMFQKRKQLLDHRRCHRLRKHQCTHCGKMFDRRNRWRHHMDACSLRMKKKQQDLEDSASKAEEYTRDLLQMMEAEHYEESSSSMEALPQNVEINQESESKEEDETYEIIVYAEDFEEQE
nr:zinc finger protein 445-like [Aedes albopictus]